MFPYDDLYREEFRAKEGSSSSTLGISHSTPPPGTERSLAKSTGNGTKNSGARDRKMVLLLKPSRGGFLRPFGCGWFIREFLMGNGPYGSPMIDPETGAPQRDICYQYKTALMRETALDRATREEERRARHEKRPIDPDDIEKLTEKLLACIPYKTTSCRFHSFVVYFSNIQKLCWVEATGREESSAFQDHYPHGPSRRYFRLTEAGWEASDDAWANPWRALYGQR